MSEIKVSSTGQSTGYGKYHWHKVVNLSDDDKKHLMSGGILIIAGCPGHKGNGRGITFRQVYKYRGAYYHCVPSQDIIDRCAELGLS